MFRKTQILLVSASAITLAGCATPFGTSTTDIKWDANPSAGTITVSDPKIYRREALINERRDERKWLDDLLEKSKTIEIKPEIIREIEVISAFSAGLGLNFDPAAGQSFTRNEETNDLRQQINVMRLQLELDQLRRDAELVRANFADQATPANENLGQLGATDLVANPGVTAAAAADAFTTLTSTIDSLTARLGATVNQPQIANASVNPIDEFRDRQAYRDILKTARNAASLDEQHDLDGNALLRLNFQATTLPGHKEPNVPGVVQVKLSQPEFTEQERRGIYAGWLSHINERINEFDAKKKEFKPNPTLLAAASLGNFELVYYDYPKTSYDLDKCLGGLRLSPSRKPDSENCGSLVFAAPAFSGQTRTEGAFSSLSQYLALFRSFPTPEALSERIRARSRLIVTGNGPTGLASGCRADPNVNFANNALAAGPASDEAKILHAIRAAEVRTIGASSLLELDRKAQIILRSNGQLIPEARDSLWPIIAEGYRQSALLLANFEQRALGQENCGDNSIAARKAFREGLNRVEIPASFQIVLDSPYQAVSVYDIAPREQAQQVSTVARNANSLGLALSIAASKPGAGIGGNLGANYVRQANGKAATIERAPTVVGYSMAQTEIASPPTTRVFGWVLGPKATIHPKGGRLELEQSLSEYDLSADVSVPGWWPRIDLKVDALWAPNVASVTKGVVSGGERNFTVRRAINASDYDALTEKLTRLGQPFTRSVEIRGTTGTKLSYCKPTTIHLDGNTLWRATSALVLGKQLGSEAIRMSSDMGGIFLTVPALKSFAPDSSGNTKITVFTPLGPDFTTVDLETKPKDDCEEEKPKADPNAITITSINPSTFTAGNSIPFRVEGTNLDKVTSVKLAGAEELSLESREGKTVMNWRLKDSQARGLSGEQTLILYQDGKKKGDPKVAVHTASVQVNAAKK